MWKVSTSERRDPKGTGVSGTHRCGHPADKGSPGEQGGPGCAVAGPCKRLWVIAHKLVKEALNHHIQGRFRDLILDTYNSFNLCWVYNLRVPLLKPNMKMVYIAKKIHFGLI